MDQQVIEALEFVLRPTPPAEAASLLTQLRSLTVSRSTGQVTLDLQAAAYTERLVAYPPWAIRASLNDWVTRQRQKFFPTWGEFSILLDNQVALPRALLRAYRDAQVTKPTPKVKAPRDLREIPRDQWTATDWDQHVRGALTMATTMSRMAGPRGQRSLRDWLQIARERLADAKTHGCSLDLVVPDDPPDETPVDVLRETIP